MVVYAKSRPPETLTEHTQRLLNGLQELKRLYGNTILQRVPDSYRPIFWDALELVVKCHDLGKIHTPFQNEIRRKLKLSLLLSSDVPELPHNILSPAFIKPLMTAFSKDVQRAIYQAIAFHHFHGVEFDYPRYTGRWNDIDMVVKKDLTPVWKERLASMACILPLDGLCQPTPAYKRYLEPVITTKDGDLYRLYIMLKGLLHRLDHSASAHLPAEEDSISNPIQRITYYLVNKRSVALESIWQKDMASNLADKNVILTASTGIGKTEFALYWLNGQKGFHTLPVRTSVNAMYDRMIETFEAEDRIGLLHSDAYFYCLEDHLLQNTPLANENREGATLNIRYVDAARQFAMPLTVCTADQLFPAVFKYKGYEKIYATLAYSKVIIDEIQSYDPDLAAVILRGLVELAKLGGQFCVVTATLPPIYREYLEKHVPNLKVLPAKYLPARKHKVKLEEGRAVDDKETLHQIFHLYELHRKVLVIVNTVKKAQTLYCKLGKLQEQLGGTIPISLLHAGFTYRDRRDKESAILSQDASGVWITTQLAEVSLNIDFPVLLTEVATIDALIQRMGRVLRFSPLDFVYDGPPNVFVYSNASGISSIYDEDIVRKTVAAIRGERVLSEADKARFIEEIFTTPSLQETSYLKKFRSSLQMLESGFEANTRSQAQRLFRNITNLSVIPCDVYRWHASDIDKALAILESKEASRLERFQALATLKGFSVSIPVYRAAKATLSPLKERDLFLITMGYTKELGLEPSAKIENIF